MPPVLLHDLGQDPLAPMPPTERDIDGVATMLGEQADARTAELDEERAIPPDLYRAAAAAGLFRQLVAAELGGLARTNGATVERNAQIALGLRTDHFLV